MSTSSPLADPAPEPSHAGISVRGVARSFGSVHAVRDVTFDARPGRITGLVGPNGAGKTTLFLMLASLLAPDRGEIRIGGVDPSTDAAAVRERIGWMPDALGAWEALTARETLTVAGRLYGAPKTQAATRADELLAEVGLRELAAAPARVLSRGQKQLLGLARALVHRPPVLLLDEPASGLDPAARIALRRHLRALADGGAAILVSSHVLAELEEMVDDAVFMSEGATVAQRRDGARRGLLRDWRLRVAGTRESGPGPWLEAVRHTLPDANARVDRRGLLLGFSDEVSAAQGLGALIAAGILVAEFAPASGDLESAFLQLKGDER
ncbi:ABC transporter ATP-binding protein [Microbacterium karelineae]|uniref:ABC transporter ATP-binding protein n=1 Tax=Microbacterium karelineae TaxID=2654283 RepID=UPI0012EAE348|nr:ABC transporter ATP-binding protein [Microbacterium karelineae]